MIVGNKGVLVRKTPGEVPGVRLAVDGAMVALS